MGNEQYTCPYCHKGIPFNKIRNALTGKLETEYNNINCIKEKLKKDKSNWEKQFKGVDLFRKALVHHLGLVKANKKYLNDIIDANIHLCGSSRSLLAKNALVLFEDLFEIKDLSYYDKLPEIIKTIVKKMQYKNNVIKEEAIRAMICLIMFLNIEKTSTILLDNYTKNKNHDTICLIIMCFGFYLKYHREKIFNLANWNKMMVFVQEQYNLKRNIQSIRDACLDFFLIIKNYFRSDERFEDYMKNYFSLQSLTSLLMFMNLSQEN